MYEVQMIWWMPLVGTMIWMIWGGIWYHPKFPAGSSWMKHTGLTEEIIKERMENGEVSMKVAFGAMICAGLVMNFILLHVAQYSMYATETWGVTGGIISAGWCWLGFVAVDIGAYGFEARTWKLYIIDKGWILLAMLSSGILVGALISAP
jgi:hypothetical protein